jgi:hypothetical protein
MMAADFNVPDAGNVVAEPMRVTDTELLTAGADAV